MEKEQNSRFPPSQDWDGTDRRSVPDPLTALREHIDDRFDSLMEVIKSGYPNGDPVEHRKVHEGYIREAKQRTELREAIIKQILTGVAWGTMVLLAGLAWAAFKAEVKK